MKDKMLWITKANQADHFLAQVRHDAATWK